MKKTFYLVCIFCCLSVLNASSQWQTSGNNTYYNNGNVGIGITTPTEALTVKGKVYIQPIDYIDGWHYSYLSWSGHSLVMGSPRGTYAYNSIDLKPGGADEGYLYSQLRLYTALNRDQHELNIRLTSRGSSFFNGGNVGIGTTDPEHKLDVVGTIRAHQVLVNTQKGADFVFEDGYALRPLEEVEQFISENKHLPDIPSARAMVEEGIAIGELQVQLLQKIEELTLYVIELKKENEVQQEKIKMLEQLLNK